MSNSIDEAENENVSKGWFRAGISTIILALLTPVIIMLASGTTFNVSKLGKLGAVGDFFGGSTIGLLSIASIFFIIHTIHIQSKELSLQRRELELTRNELVETRKVHQEANHTQVSQRFENTFFNILSIQNELINSLEMKSGSESAKKGREVTAYLFKRLHHYYLSKMSNNDGRVTGETASIEKFSPIYKEFLDNYGDYIEPYFRNIEILMYSIANSEFTRIEKNHYLDILKAQMSKSELKLLYYNSAYTNEFSETEKQYINLEFFIGDLEPSDLIHIDHKNFLSR